MKFFLVVVVLFGVHYKFGQTRTFIGLPKYQCPNGWDVNASTKLCYKLINRPMQQIFAQQYCKVLKAKLVRIQDKDENDFVRGR